MMKLSFNEVSSGKSIPVQAHDKIRVQAAPGEKYHLIDDATGKNPADLQVTREGNSLYLRSEEFNIEIVVEEFWEACQPGSTQCYAIIDTPEYVGGELVGETIVTQEGAHLGTLLAGEIGTLAESATVGLLTTATAAIAPSALGFVGVSALAAGVVGVAASGGGSSNQEEAPQDTTAPDMPSIGITEDGKTVSGKAEANSTVSIKNAAGDEIGKATADKDGNYTVDLTKTPLTNGEKITADATDAAGNTSPKATTNATDSTPPNIDSAKIDPTDGTTVKGKAEPNSTVTIKDAKGNIIGTGKADENGDYAVTLSNPQQNGQKVTATATDKAGNTSEPISDTAPDITPPKAPSVAISQDGTKATGVAEPNSTVTIKDKDGNVIGTATAGVDGKYEIPLTPALINGEKITATATDAAKNKSPEGHATATDSTPPNIESAEVNQTDGKTVTGKTEPNSTVTIKDEKGNIIGTGKADENGNYTVTLSNPQQNGQKVTATATDEAGNTSKEPVSATAPDITAPDAPTGTVSGDGTTVSGKAEPNSTVKIYDKNGALIGEGTADNNGSYGPITLKTPQKDGDDITATATDAEDNTSFPATVHTPDKTAPDTPDATISDDGTTVSGKAEPNSTVTIKDATGNVLGTAKADANGDYSVKLSTPQTNGQELKATATDAAGNLSDPADVNAPDKTAPDIPKVAISQDGTKATGSAEPNSTVTIKDKDGNVIGTATANADGEYEIPLTPALTNGEKITATATDKAGNKSPEGHATAQDTTKPDAPSIDKVSADGLTVTGKAEPNSTVTIKDATGNVLGTAKADADGNYNVPLKTAQKNGQEIKATATDAANNESEPTTGYAQDKTAPDAPSVAISQDGTKATGSAEPNSTVTLKDEAGKVIGTATADKDGNYEIPLTDALTNGEKITATATDKAGNESQKGHATATDSTPPKAPEAFISDDGKTVKGTAEPNSTVTIKDKDGNTLGTATVGKDGKYEVTLKTPQTDGQDLKATATDAAGNPSPETGVKAPDNTPPADPTVSGSLLDNVDVVGGTPLPAGQEQPITADSNNNTNDNTPSLVIPKAVADAATADGNTPKLVVDNKVVDAVVSQDADGNTVLTPKEPLAEGEHTVSYLLQDSAGNQSGAAPATTFTVDTQAPDKPAKPESYKDNVGDVQSDASTAPTTDDTTPGINIGKVPEGETPTLYVDGEEVEAEITKDADGNTTLTPKIPLGEGAHNLTYTLTDTAGNESDKSDPITVTVDTVAPDAATIALKNDTGTSNNDGITNDGELNITPAADSTIKSVIATKADDGTTVEIPVTDGKYTLPEGKYSKVVVTTQDAAGNEATQETGAITVDTTNPESATIALKNDTGTENNDGITNDGELNITPAADSTIKSVIATKADGTTVEIPVTDGKYTLPEGEYSKVVVTAQDAAGNEATQETGAITVDTTAPTGVVTKAEISLDVDNDGYINNGEKGSATTTDVKVSIDSNVVAGDVVTLDVGGTVTKHTVDGTDISNQSVTFTGINLPNEGETLTVKAGLTDAAGNDSPTTVSDSAVLDTTIPSKLTISFPQDTSKDGTLTSSATGDAELAYDATTVDVRVGFIASDVQVGDTIKLTDTDGNTRELIVSQTDIDNGYVATSFPKPAEDSALKVSASIKDTAGNTYEEPTASSVTINLLPPGTPTVEIVADTNNDGYINKAENDAISSKTDILVKFPIESGEGFSATEEGYVVSIKVNGGTPQEHTLTAAEAANGEYKFTNVTIPASGEIKVTTSLKDKTGTFDKGTQEGALGNDTAIIDTTLPTVAITSEATGKLKAGETIKVTFTLSEASNDFTASDVITSTGTLTDFQKTSDTVYTATFTPAENTDSGSTTISIANGQFSDVAGNQNADDSEPNNNLVINYDTKAPTATIALNDIALKKGDVATVIITFSEAVTGFTVDDLIAENGTLSNLQQNGSNPKEYTATFTPTANIEDTSNTISLAKDSYTDTAGNNGSAAHSGNYTIDTKAPTVSVNEQTTNDATPAITGTVDDPNAVVKVQIGSETYTATNNGDGTWTLVDNAVTALAEGENNVVVTATDAVGNAGTGNANVTIFTPEVSIAVSPDAVAEGTGEDAPAKLTYTITMDKAPTVDTIVTVAYSGTATAGEDYIQNGTSIVIKAGETTGTIEIDPTNDAVVESDETIIVALQAGTNYKLSTTNHTATGTINNDDQLSLDIADANDSFSTENTNGNNTDNYTNKGIIDVKGIPSGETWQYSLDGGTNWTTGTGNSIQLDDNTETAGVAYRVQARLTNAPSTASETLNMTLDQTTNVALQLHQDSAGESNTDRISNQGQVDISGLETDGVWQYSTDSGNTWTTGTDTSFTLQDGLYNADVVQVRQIDKAGNIAVAKLAQTGIDTVAPTIAQNAIEEDKQLLVDGVVFDTEQDNTIGYFEGAKAGIRLGKIIAKDDANPDITTEYNSGIYQYEWDTTKGTEQQRSWYKIDTNGNITLTEAGATSAMNDYEDTSVNEVTLTVKVSDVAGNVSTRDITFKLGNVIGIASISDELSTTQALNEKGLGGQTDSNLRTTEEADKIFVGKKENGEDYTGAGVGNLFDWGSGKGFNFGTDWEKSPHLFAKGGNDFVSFADMWLNSKVFMGHGNDVLQFTASRGDNGTSNGAPLVMMEQGDDIFSTKSFLNAANVLMGSGSDSVIINGNVGGYSTIDLGTADVKNFDGDELYGYKLYKQYQWGDDLSGDVATDVNTVKIVGNLDGAYIHGGVSQDNITVDKNVTNAKIDLGDGNNTVKITGNLSGGYIQVGVGQDSITIDGNASNTKIDLGDGNNTLYVGGRVDGDAKIIGGTGEDTVTIKGNLNDSDTIIDLGGGNDTLTIEGGLGTGGGSTVKMGDGDDTLIYKGAQTNIDSAEIKLLDGGLGVNDVLDLSQATGNGYIQYDYKPLLGANRQYIKGFETIKLGDGHQDGGLRLSKEGLQNDDVDTLKIDGTASSKVSLQGNSGNWMKADSTEHDGYYSYTNGDQSVLISDVIVNAGNVLFY